MTFDPFPPAPCGEPLTTEAAEDLLAGLRAKGVKAIDDLTDAWVDIPGELYADGAQQGIEDLLKAGHGDKTVAEVAQAFGILEEDGSWA